jgi:hypothetical protein
MCQRPPSLFRCLARLRRPGDGAQLTQLANESVAAPELEAQVRPGPTDLTRPYGIWTA